MIKEDKLDPVVNEEARDVMLRVVKRVVDAEKKEYESNESDVITPDTPAKSKGVKKNAKLSGNHLNFQFRLPTYPGFQPGVADLYRPCSRGMKSWRKSINCDIESFIQCSDRIPTTTYDMLHHYRLRVGLA